MCNIYQDSILTIAASCSASDCAGFLQERMINDPIELNGPQRFKSVRFRRAIDHSRMFREDPIHARAWTFQEAILPHRLLSFGSRETTWECETLRKCECGQIEYGQDSRANPNELGRAAYRKYARAVIEGGFQVGKKHDLPGLSAHLQPRIVDRDLFDPSVIERYAEKLFAEGPPVEDQDASREYIKNVRRRTVHAEFAATSAFTNYFDALASDDHEPYLQHILSRGPSYDPRGVKPEDGPAYAEWLKSTYVNTLVVSAFHRYWRRVLVPEYTRRALSIDSDRLIALQAIASDIHSGIQDRYLAGLWEGDLINQLCWQSADGQGLPANNQSPSWSWSSIRGPVVPYSAEKFVFDNSGFGQKELKIDKALHLGRMIISNVDCSLASANPCGRILNGSITLKASAMEVRYIKNKTTGLFEFHASAYKSEHTEPAVSKLLRLDFSPDTPLGCQSDGSLTRSAEKDYLNTRHHDHVTTAMVLFVDCADNGDFCVLVCGLVPAAAESNIYRRLGIGTLEHGDLKSFSSYCFKGKFVLI